MAYQQSDLDKLDAMIVSGVRRITFADGRSTEYQNLDQLLAAKQVIAAEIKMQANVGGNVVRRRVPYYRSGL
jgi:hypothetical protein